jgi:hypothetical protein
MRSGEIIRTAFTAPIEPGNFYLSLRNGIPLLINTASFNVGQNNQITKLVFGKMILQNSVILSKTLPDEFRRTLWNHWN